MSQEQQEQALYPLLDHAAARLVKMDIGLQLFEEQLLFYPPVIQPISATHPKTSLLS